MFDFLSAIGITPDKYPYLSLAIVIIVGIGYLRISIGRSMSKTNDCIGKIKLNVKAIVAFLSAYEPKKFNPLIIESMSPLNIKEQGYSILKDSGFEAIMNDPESRIKILLNIAEQNPSTRLDVERYSIIFFNTLLECDYMNPIKTYLYDHPDMRDVYPTLAGLYIRDQYLKDHPEITA